MNKKKLITIIVLVVIVVVGLSVVGFSHRAKAPEVTTSMVPTSTSGSLSVTASSTSSSTNVVVAISTSTQRSYSNGSFSLSYPSSWSIARYLPFLITNFNGQYQTGGIIPVGGAQIYVVTTTIESGYLQSVINTQLMSAINITTTTLVVDGVACPAAAYEAAYAPGVTSKNVSVYCSRGGELWEVYLSYEANDTAAASAAHISDFNGVLGSMKFL